MPYRAWLLALVVGVIVISATAPTDRFDWCLEHVPTATVIAWLIWYERSDRGAPLSDVSYSLLAVFLMLHAIGAHYLYSNVPYREWAESLLGELPRWLESDRNHYDRFVHLCFGLLVLLPVAELVRRHVTDSRHWSVLCSIAFIGVFSKVYELLEWGVAITLSPEAAETYNGQQGDMFDAHKDMGLALLGSLLAAPWVSSRIPHTDGP